MRAERRGWRTSPGASDIWRLCICASKSPEIVEFLMPELWWKFVAWKQLCGWDIHLEETKIDIILEVLFFSIKGEEEVDYLYNNLADLADSEKLLICRSPMAVPWHFMFDFVKGNPFLQPSNGWGMWWPGVFVGTKGWGSAALSTRLNLKIRKKRLVAFCWWTNSRSVEVFFCNQADVPDEVLQHVDAEMLVLFFMLPFSALWCLAVGRCWKLSHDMAVGKMCHVICHQSMIFFENQRWLSINLKETKNIWV